LRPTHKTETPGRFSSLRTAFVLAGGAALGAVQAGMVRALHERGITPDLLAGTSAGALNAAFPASRPPTVATAEHWRPSGAGCGAATSSPPPAHGRGLGTMRPRISAKP
jgi:NTE family protein